MQLVSNNGNPIRARLVNNQWEFLDSQGPTGFYLPMGDTKELKRLGISEIDGEHIASKQDLTIYPRSPHL